MKDFQFHAEMPEERKSKSASKAFPFQPWTRATLKRYAAEGKHVNVCAVATDRSQHFTSNGEHMIECISSLFDHENSVVCGSSCSRSYLDARNAVQNVR